MQGFDHYCARNHNFSVQQLKLPHYTAVHYREQLNCNAADPTGGDFYTTNYVQSHLQAADSSD